MELHALFPSLPPSLPPFGGAGVEPTFLTTVPFSLLPTELLTQDFCSTAAGIWPWEMELGQAWIHLPVAILVWPWSTRGQVWIMEKG